MKKPICLLLSLMLIVTCLAACSGGKEPTAGSGSASSDTVSEKTDAESTASPSKPADDPVNTSDNTVASADDSGKTSDNTDASADDPANTSANTDTPAGEPLDMEAFLGDLDRANPDKSADALCDLMLEDPYFRLFVKQRTMDYYPGLDYEFTPEGVKTFSCIIDYMSSNSIVYVIVPEEGTDAKALAESFEKAVDPYWTREMKLKVLSRISDGRIFLAIYKDGLMPFYGELASEARDFTDMFHNYLKEHPDTALLPMLEYFSSHQKLAEMGAREVQEGTLTGFGSFEEPAEITGFSEGAVLEPMMSPNTFICYAFRLPEGADREAFVKMLNDNANLVWNVCVAANTIIIENDGDCILFMMCSESR